MGAIGFGPSLVIRGSPLAGFDFMGGVLPPGAQLTRASPASRFDAARVLRIDPADTPRFDHDPATGMLLGLLIEAEGRNDVLRSEDVAHAAWTKTQSPTIASDSGIAPDGTATADTLGDTNAGQYSSVSQSFTDATARTVSVFIRKDATGRNQRFVMLRGGPPLSDLSLDTSTGEVSGSGAGVLSGWAQDCGDFWRLVLVNGPGSDRIELYPAAGASTSWTYSSPTTGVAIVWGFQAERGATPTSYIPTGAAAATRAADVLTLDWGRFGVADGPLAIRYVFDDGSIQNATADVIGGRAAVPATLGRPWLRRVERR